MNLSGSLGILLVYRDGKQHTGLSDSQAWSENKLNFRFNASLNSINIARVIHCLSLPKEERKPFSISDIKIMNHNTLLLQRFIDVFGISPYSIQHLLFAKTVDFDFPELLQIAERK